MVGVQLPICPMCGYKEAVVFFPESLQEKVLRTIQASENTAPSNHE